MFKTLVVDGEGDHNSENLKMSFFKIIDVGPPLHFSVYESGFCNGLEAEEGDKMFIIDAILIVFRFCIVRK